MSKFLKTFTMDHAEKLDASSYIIWDLETTGLTPTSRPIAVGGTAKIGPITKLKDYKLQTGSTVNCSVRARVSTLALDDGEVLAWDLDALTKEDRIELIRATVDNKVIIGHNLAFDLTWGMSICGYLSPAVVLDTMLLVRCLRPEFVWEVHKKAGRGVKSCIESIENAKGNASASLSSLACGLGLGNLDKSYQHPRNWSVSKLSDGHYDYVTGDVNTPINLLHAITNNQHKHRPFGELLEALSDIDAELGGSYSRTYSKIPETLAKISIRGVPVHTETLENIEQHRSSLIPKIVDDLLELVPVLKPFENALRSTAPGVSAEVKHALAKYVSENGKTLEIGADGNPITSSKSVTLSGVSSLPGWRAWDELQRAKKVMNLCSEYKGISVQDKDIAGYRRVHPLLVTKAITMRGTSECPNVQNLIGNQRGLDDSLQFRSIVKAPEGMSIISSDYSQIELRIASALSLRCMSQVRSAIDAGYGAPSWVLDAFKAGDAEGELLAATEGFESITYSIAKAWRDCKNVGSRMANAFRSGVDPHLLTGLGMCVAQGLFDIGGADVLEYLKSRTKAEIKELKERFKDQRQSAKPLNFGLLYGMQVDGIWEKGIIEYGLTWSKEEAAKCREMWFQMYPEITVWQSWTKFAERAPARESISMLVRDTYSNKVEMQDIRLGSSSTLSGRPVVAALAREITNYSDQGTCSDMLWETIVNMRTHGDSVMNTIHDEIQLLVPDNEVEEAKDSLQDAMLAAANRVLGPYNIPSEAEPTVSKYWRKD